MAMMKLGSDLVMHGLGFQGRRGSLIHLGDSLVAEAESCMMVEIGFGPQDHSDASVVGNRLQLTLICQTLAFSSRWITKCWQFKPLITPCKAVGTGKAGKAGKAVELPISTGSTELEFDCALFKGIRDLLFVVPSS